MKGSSEIRLGLNLFSFAGGLVGGLTLITFNPLNWKSNRELKRWFKKEGHKYFSSEFSSD